MCASNVLSIFDYGQERLESISALAFQCSGVNRKINSMTATSVLSAQINQQEEQEFISLSKP